MFRQILVAFDGSPHARRALADAIELAQANRGWLTVMAVVPDPNLWLGVACEVPVNLGGRGESAPQEYQAMLDRAAQIVPADVPVTKLVKRGVAAAAIVAEARDHHHDLIVMGSRGRGDFRSRPLGSVTHAVLRSSPVPVLVIRRFSDPRCDVMPPPHAESNTSVPA